MNSCVQNIHNIMEEVVKVEVDKLFYAAEAHRPDWLSCTCNQCRGDVVCYVLNKVQPKYVHSGRGIAHYIDGSRIEKPQINADVAAIALEGMKQILQRKRHQAAEGSSLGEGVALDTPVFSFPAITGRVLDGLSFEPLTGARAELYLDGELCKPLSAAWENPCITNEHTPGNFAFSVKPLPASFANERKVFDFEIRISAAGKDSVVHFVKIGATGGDIDEDVYNSSNTVVLPDLFIFPSEDKFSSIQ